MVGLNVADYVSTPKALKYPAFQRSIPDAKPFIKAPPPSPPLSSGRPPCPTSMRALFKRNKTVAWVMTTASNVLLSYVVANNYRLIQGARVR